MPILPSRLLPRLLLGLSVLFIGGCLGDKTPSAPDSSDDNLTPPPSLETETEGWLVRCQVDAAARTFACGAPNSQGTGGAQSVIVGGQNQYVTLGNDPVEIAGGVLTADVWVQNLLPQPLGATTLDATIGSGIRVFFHTPPSNGVTVANPDGTGTFTGSSQQYFQYVRIAQPFDRTIRKPWQFALPEGVTTFTFEVYVEAEVPFPDGWVEITPGGDGLAVGEDVQLSAQAYNVVGAEVSGRTFTWGTSNSGVVSVTASGLASGVAAGGPAIITAISDGPEAVGAASFTVGGSDLELVVGATPDIVEQGGVLTHFISVTNNGPSLVSTARIRLEVQGKVFRVWSPLCPANEAQPEPGTQGFTCDLFLPLADGEGQAFFVEVRTSDAQTITSRVFLDQLNGSDDLSADPNATNNEFTATTIVEDIPDGDLSLVSTVDSPDPVVVGSPLSYVVTVSNSGTVDAAGVTIDLRVDDNGGAAFTSSTEPAGCQQLTTLDNLFDDEDLLFRCELGPIPAGGSVPTPSLSITPGAGLAGTTLSAIATFRLIEGVYDANAVNESAVASTTINSGSD
ncbi:MAG: hypothetical protein JSU98_12560 [Gemmatimonadales bacterium]|nr:MAG: hypothetical protein JSU98_12560 [Gemmatimonadales bacterium]